MTSSRRTPSARSALFAASLVLPGCATAGSSWMAEPLPSETESGHLVEAPPPEAPPKTSSRATRVIGARAPNTDPAASDVSDGPGGGFVSAGPSPAAANDALARAKARAAQAGGRILGSFRNTYYDFPSEADFEGPQVPLKNARCETLAQVPRGFYESVCVQGSGTLRSGATVSFAKRDCDCAEVCPRTEQRICFDSLDPAAYPWGRGATGKAITPLLSVAVDTEVIPLGTPLYIPELDGLPRDSAGGALHDGCFIAQDRGVRVKGNHVDIFTGHASITTLWNRLVPSNQGVTVIVDAARCARAK